MKRTTYFFFFYIIFCNVSCKKDFLIVDNTDSITRQSYVNSIATMDQFLNGIYVVLNRDYDHGIGAAAYPEIAADNLKPNEVGGPLPNTRSLIAQYTWLQEPTENFQVRSGSSSSSMNAVWGSGYNIIRSCSFIIEEIDKYRNENPLRADDIKGQALALRAMIHFKIVNTFAQSYTFSTSGEHPGIPYITTADITIPYSRQTVAEVYSNMISDYINAIALLPVITSDVRYMNRTAAKALLARTYLFKEDYINAKALASEIANQVPLMTIGSGYPNDIFKFKNSLPTEVLFQQTPINLGAPYISAFLGRYLRGTTIYYRATNDIATILRENPTDVRSSWVTSVSGLWNVTKFPSGVANETPAIAVLETSYYPPVIRTSEMFLTVAEASAKTGDEITARDYLNRIRKRAYPGISDVVATGQPLLDSIYKERRKELSFEGLRMYDLQRLRTGVSRIDALVNVSKILPYPSEKAVSPLPLNEINIAGLQQNPGY